MDLPSEIKLIEESDIYPCCWCWSEVWEWEMDGGAVNPGGTQV